MPTANSSRLLTVLPRGWVWVLLWPALVGLSVQLVASGAAPSETQPAIHWAFQPVKAATPPPVRNSNWPRTWVDPFILARLESQGLQPTPSADPATLLRRVSFDLTGLPPNREEIDAFVRDPSPDAFGKVVDKLLASPHYGERWGQHWMDVVRYADTAGDNADYPVPEARRYRDYIIAAFNADKPYDDFVREQIAGDLLARQGPRERYAERVIATGFIALSRRYATAPFEFRHLIIEDSIETLGRTFLGMTFRCARCHDHKYDPVSKEDYYGLYGFFASTRYPYAGSEEFESKKFPRSGFVPLVPPEEAAPAYQARQQRLEALQAQIQALESELAAAPAEVERKKSIEARLKPLQAEYRGLNLAGVPEGLPVAYAVVDGQPMDVPLQVRGEPDQLGKTIARGTPRCLSHDPVFPIATGTSGRLELANWLTQPQHPLTARVLVNRIWQHHFGKGLVATPSNFGIRGDPPTHPELLDTLAHYFVEHGWSVKSLHRLILNSATWQQASTTVHARAREDDPNNRLYARFDRRRLEAESLRDAMLVLSGHLDVSLPREHPFPKIAEWHWTQHTHFKAVYESAHRSVYLMRQRLQRHPYLSLFDAPDANVSTDVRTSATVPLQALYLMNNPFVAARAEGFAQRLLQAQGTSTEARVEDAYRQAWSRSASPSEQAQAQRFLEQFQADPSVVELAAPQRELAAWTALAKVLLTANEFCYLD